MSDEEKQPQVSKTPKEEPQGQKIIRLRMMPGPVR